ncbi:MAG TPA: DEAD/DEAH box helicase family protein [Mycobacteriales bacterium]|nr:DEAD/DEAH box helicase family protein [Mycobacteriales bacterium]
MSLPHALRVPDHRPRLRAWQARALAAYDAAGAPRDFLVTATPGSGKTTFALALAEKLLAARAVTRVIVVAPTDHLRTQWAQAAHAAGLSLDPTLSNAVGPVGPDFVGYVTTYAQVAGKPLLHRRRTEAKKTLVILDEIHHAGDGLSWGLAVEEAFDPAVRRLCLSGTPFRTRADERIPFVRYEDAEGDLRSVADHGYGYKEALADGVVRPVVFAAYTGVARWRNSAGEVIAASLSEPLTREAEMAAWRTALDPRGKWVPHVIAAMDDRLSHIRSAGMPDAAGLVLASDQDDARAYAEIVHRVTGRRPALILSDDPRASAKIAKFAASDARIAVCVRMISEGVDIPRAACLAWLTAYRTPLFFAQAVGRVVRARRRGESATVFLPAVRPLLTLAAELEAERGHVLRAAPPGEELDPPVAPEDQPGLAQWEALEAEASFAHVLHGGRAVLGDEGIRPATDDEEDFLGLPGLLSPQQTADLLSRRDADLRARLATVPDRPAEEPAEGAWQRTGALRREVNALVAQVAARTGQPHGAVHAAVRSAVPGPASASAGAALLAARRDHLLGLR